MANWSIHERKCFSFTWALENFSFCWQKRGERILSPSFIVDTIERSKWKLMLYPNGDWSKNSLPSDSISFNLRREEDSKGPTDITIFFELSFLAADGSAIMSSEISEDFFDRGKDGGSPKFLGKELLQSERQKFLPHDILTVRCRMWKNFGQMIEERQCFARTRIGVERRSFIWTVPEFCFDKFSFNIKSILDDKRVMTLNLNLRHELYNGLQVILEDKRLKCTILNFHLLDAFGNKVKYLKKKVIFAEYKQNFLCPLSIFMDEVMEDKDLYLPDNILTLHCECSFTAGVVLEEIEKITFACPPSIQEGSLAQDNLENKNSSDLTRILLENLESLYKENLLCDTKLKTKTRTFPTHQNILSARSPVFKAMFNNDMKEKNSEYVYIEDLDDDTVQRMLLYIYTATVPDLQWDTACDLYTAADKYEILSLKSKCSSFLKDNLSQGNACNLLIFADEHQDQDLISLIQDYILIHRGIFNTKEWELFMKTNLQLAANLMHLKLKE
ncbi:TD and POZ domain-containing protein 3 [Trichonephila inaurata madagascariensis]|uniref:TD and POZ domain-containing protein 3 n=1 Tax=Trichonephila inaurata madagascariensis TaxID=2747483 RepID=A0A8X7C854_9ARAC|nr:TD and POZ domain-containing protein 3 [Trichonephila inaurata madagascariensis]